MKALYYIEWADPMSIDEWVSIDAIDPEYPTVISVGQLVKETENVYVLALNFDKLNEKASCIMIIPKNAVVNKGVIDA